MVITFPNMGNVATAATALFQGLRIPYIAPRPNSARTLELGAYHSPEEICLPFKLVLGNCLEAVEQGADTFIITGSCGPCRFGEYCEMLMKILRKLGHHQVEVIVADLSSDVGLDGFLRRIGRISQASPLSKLEQLKALQTALKVLELCDKLDARAHKLAGYEANQGDCRRILAHYRSRIARSQSPAETLSLLREGLGKLDAVPLDPEKDPLKVAIIGEIFTVIDPFTNLYLEEKLMERGVSTSRMLTPSWWVKDLLLKPFKLNSLALNQAADLYLPYCVGGHGRECVGEAVLAKEHGMDAAIQVYPLGCMPEVIAKAVLPTIQKERDIPIMTLVVDEVTGEAGYVTRIEAFLDMLESRKRARIQSRQRQGEGRAIAAHAKGRLKKV